MYTMEEYEKIYNSVSNKISIDKFFNNKKINNSLINQIKENKEKQ